MAYNVLPVAASAGITCCRFSCPRVQAGHLRAGVRGSPALRQTVRYALGGCLTCNRFCKLVLQMGLQVTSLSFYY